MELTSPWRAPALFLALSWALFVLAAGCGGSGGAPLDVGPRDAGTDTGAVDAGADAEPADVGPDDVGPEDAGGGPGDAGPPDTDGGPEDAGAADGGPEDAGAPDAGPPDPGVCAVGDADGCCPLGLRYGGADPDCPSLACATATLSDPIVLEAEGASLSGGYEGTAAVSWTGRDLVVAWAAIKDADETSTSDLWVQRRDATTGALLRGPDRRLDVTPRTFAWGGADLAWAPRAGRSLFVAYAPVTPYAGVLLDADDAPVADPTFGASCNGFHQTVEVVDAGDRYFVTQVTESCASPTNPTLRVTPVSHDGVAGTPITQPAVSRLGLASAFDPVGRRILMLWKETTGGYGDLRGRLLDVDTLTAGTPFLVTAASGSSVDQVRAGFDGERFGILWSRYSSGGGFSTSFGLYDPDGGGLTPTATIPTPSGRRYAQARIAWTGDSWVLLVTTIASTGTSLAPSATDSPELWLHRLDPAGALLESRRVDAASTQTRYPAVAFAGAAVALTWTRFVAGVGNQHVLALLSCPE